MIHQQHSIQKASLKLGFASEKSARRWQEEYLRTFREQVLPALEEVLDSFAREGETIRLQRLHIDLGKIPSGPPGRAFTERLQSQLARQLAELIHTGEFSKNGVEVLSAEVSRLELLEGFLLRGQLPGTGGPGLQEFIRALWQESPEKFLATLRRATRKAGATVARRLACQLEPSLLMEVMSRLVPGVFSTEARALWHKIQGLSPSSTGRVSEVFWAAAMQFSLEKREGPQKELLSAFYREFCGQAQAVGIDKQILEGILPSEVVLATEPEEPAAPDPEPAEQPDPDAIYGSNSGVILLHPFLSSYFQEFGLLDAKGEAFTDTRAQMKAVYLLHFLATGQWLCPEPQLAIQKVLCGLPVHHPISREFELTEAEREESDKLLRAVLKHWSALGNTSPDGLREGFLQREGKLQRQDGGWLLQIEKKAMDLLLDKLPWNISLIRLPWLKELIRVEWG